MEDVTERLKIVESSMRREAEEIQNIKVGGTYEIEFVCEKICSALCVSSWVGN